MIDSRYDTYAPAQGTPAHVHMDMAFGLWLSEVQSISMCFIETSASECEIKEKICMRDTYQE